ncbi:MAG TPA: LLM class flavin-dependent oxidoreductase [Alphaproteobacteria bacterium]|jgi:alkanesulfonate monooxygenase SsuD/methylene tetrahydromethanopterin reductase-like flavin-dependent oxidoreductase (luciferase family)|nr:LLM class flavin-dependent oxidoreductase [Alphaproteobacteria bacterium]
MEFGYFTLSDNHYPNNKRSPEQFITEIREQAIYADQLGYHSCWIGEHHFDSLGVNSRPDIVLASIAPITKRVRLAPAVSVLPLHHPLHVAECWATLDLLSGGRVDFAAGRGYDRMEYQPFGADFMKSAEVFEEGMDVVLKAWNSPGKWSHKGKYYNIDEMQITPRPVQKPIPFYVASFSQTSSEMAARKGLNIIYAPFAAGMIYGGLDKAVASYREQCVKYGNKPGRAMCSYFIFIADNPKDDDYGRQSQLDYFNHCVVRALPSDPTKAPPTMQYMLKIVDTLKNMKKENLTDKSILIGSPQQIIDSLKKVEAAGIEEVILYFNVGLKPHSLVKEQMDRFIREIAPAFEGQHKRIAAE